MIAEHFTTSVALPHARRNGISVLEVLISIGILSIGLLAALALIPAGRTYLRKAAIDDRAAVTVTNAYNTVLTFGLFRENSLNWTDPPAADVTDGEDIMIRQQRRPPDGGIVGVGTSSGHPGFDGKTVDAGWRILGVDEDDTVQQTTTEHHPRDEPILKGKVSLEAGKQVVVTIAGEGAPITENVSPKVSPEEEAGEWELKLTGLDPPGDVEYETTPPFDPKTEPFTYSATATYPDASGAATSVNPATFTQSGARRRRVTRTGRCVTEYVRGTGIFDQNESYDRATNVEFEYLDSIVQQGRITTVRSSERRISGNLWRGRFGILRGTYEGEFEYPNTDNAEATLITGFLPHKDILFDAGTHDGHTWGWSNLTGQSVPAPQPESDTDWYAWAVEAGQVIELEWPASDNTTLDREVDGTDPVIERTYPLWLNGVNPVNLLHPRQETATSATYSIPNDGVVYTRMQLPDTENNTWGAAGQPKIPWDNIRGRSNRGYQLTVRILRHDRIIAVDPLMSSRLDSIVAARGVQANRNDAFNIRRRRFADFQQRHSQDPTPRAFVIPRLNWQMLSNPTLEQSLGIAELLCRGQDDVEVTDQPAGNGRIDFDQSPAAAWDVAGGNRLRRKSAGRMSWMMTLQPEDAGSVADNWHAGRYFNVDIIVFEDRPLPAVSVNPAFEGEYAFDASWSDGDGMVFVDIPKPVTIYGEDVYLDDDDIRSMFRTGAWILLAPRITYDQSPIESRQTVQWIKIQTVELEKRLGMTTVRILPETEPDRDVLVRDVDLGRLAPAGRHPVVALVYRGVVAVVSKKFRLGEAQP